MAGSFTTTLTRIAERSDATPGLWNHVYDQIDNNFATLNTGVVLPAEGRTVTDLGTYLANNAEYNVLDYGAQTDLTGDLSAVLAFVFTKLPVRGGVVRIPKGRYKALSPIVPPGRNVLLDGGRVHLIFDAGAIVYSYDATAGRSLFNLTAFLSQDGQCLITGGIFDGTNATATTSGINIHADNTTLADCTFRNFRGDGVKFTYDLAAPPIRCELRHVISLYNGRGFVADGSSPSGLLLISCSAEGCDSEGYYWKDAGQVTMIECVGENNGHVNTTKENLVVLGATSISVLGCYFEDDVNQAHISIRVDATANVMRQFRMIGGHIVGYDVVGATAIDIGAAGACRGVNIDGVFVFGQRTGIKLGASVQGYYIGTINWSDNYNPVSGTATRYVNASTGNGVIANLDHFDYATDGFEIHGRASTTGDVIFSKTLTSGATSSDQTTGAGTFYDVATLWGRVSSGAAVRSNVVSTVGNSAMLNVMGGSSAVTTGTYLQSFGSATNSRLGVEQPVNLDVLLNAGVIQASFRTDGSFNARSSLMVSGVTVATSTQLTGQLQTAAQPNVTAVGVLSNLTTTGAVSTGDGSQIAPGVRFSSESSLGFYRSAVSTVALSKGTFDLATNAVRFSMRTLAASSITASAAQTNVAVNEVVFTIGGASGASLAIYSGGTVYLFNSALSAKAT